MLEGGDYRFFAGNNCRNLTQANYVYTVDEKFVVTKQFTQRCAPTKLEKRMLADGSFETLPKAESPTASASAAAAPAAAPAVNAEPAPGSAGKLKLHDVEPKTAAMLMAIVADKMGKPINELRFISIKEVK
mgnify:CR=1 FL=1